MRLRAKANGNEFEADDEAAKELIKTGIYEEAKPAKKGAKESPTAVAPMTTADLPQKPKRGKPIK